MSALDDARVLREGSFGSQAAVDKVMAGKSEAEVLAVRKEYDKTLVGPLADMDDLSFEHRFGYDIHRWRPRNAPAFDPASDPAAASAMAEYLAAASFDTQADLDAAFAGNSVADMLAIHREYLKLHPPDPAHPETSFETRFGHDLGKWDPDRKQPSAQAQGAADPKVIADMVAYLETASFGSQEEIGQAFDGFSPADIAAIELAYEHSGTVHAQTFGERFAPAYAGQIGQLRDRLMAAPDEMHEDEARDTVALLVSLRPDLQAQALDELGDEAFTQLISGVPADSRVALGELVRNVHDPKKKVLLWREFHKGQTRADADALAAEHVDEGHWYATDTGEQDENERLNDRRDEIVATSANEADEETEFLLAKGDLSEADVEALIARKEREHQIEMEHNVNLVNDHGVRAHDSAQAKFHAGDKIVWTPEELEQIDSALDRMPDRFVAGNPELAEIRRSDVRTDGVVFTEEDPRVGGDHSSGVVRIFDTGVESFYRHTYDGREAQDPALAGEGGAQISALEETLVHEIGHDVADLKPELYRQYVEAVGWQLGQDRDDLVAAGLSAADIAKLESGQEIDHGGKHWQLDPYAPADGFLSALYNPDKFISYDTDSIPSPATGSQPNTHLTGGQDTWAYARTHPADEWAEHYMKAILKPDTLARDMIDAPNARIQAASQADLAAEVADGERKSKQFAIMREALGGDAAATQGEQEILAAGLGQATKDAFAAQAARLSTKEQVDQLLASYLP